MTPAHSALAILVTVIWGVNFTFIAWGLESFPPIMLSALRFLFTAFPLVFFVKPPKFNLTFFVYALGTFALQYGFLFFAMRVGASAGLSALILQLQVFITMILAYFFLKEQINRYQLTGLLIALLGMLVIGLHLGGDMSALGLLLLILGATGWGFGNVASTKLKEVPVLSMLVWGGLITCGCLLTVSLLLETEAWQLATFTQATVKSWASLGFIVYVSTFIGFGLWTWLLQKNDASKVVPFAFLVPISGMLTSAVLMGESLAWWKIVALVLILLGLLVSRMRSIRRSQLSLS